MPFVVLCVMEFLQYLKILSGTFDFNDLLISLIMSALFFINVKFYRSEKKIEDY